MKIETPNNIEVLIHYYVTPVIHPRYHAPAVQEAIQIFENLGCLEKDPEENYALGHYRVTPRGAKWVAALCDTELPE